MQSVLHLLFLLFTAGISFVRELRSLRNQRPLLSDQGASTETGKRPAFLDLAPIASTTHPAPLATTQRAATQETRTMLEFQIDIEKLFHKNQVMPRIKAEFTKIPDFAKQFRAHAISPEFGYDLLVQMVLHKRAHLPVLVGLLRKHFDGDCQLTADELLKCAGADLVDWNGAARQFIISFDITADVQDEIDRYQYPMPMVVPPQTLKDNRDTGYFTSKNSAILRNNHHDQDICLDHLNRVNQVRLKLDMDTVTTIKNSWRHLDKPKPDEEHKEFQRRVKAFEKYDRTAHDVLLHLGLSAGGEFYLTHKYDKRGRTYCQGYHCTYQGPTWNKAMIAFADEELVE